MTFKEFLRMSEEQSGTDKGLMGYGVPSQETMGNSPSAGQKGSDKTKPTAGARMTQGGGGGAAMGGGGAAFMKKKMKKA